MTIPRMLRDVDGNIIPQVWSGVDWIPYEGQVKNLDTLAQEATLAATRSTLDALSGKAATETKLEAVRALLATLGGKDFATQTTLAAMQTELALVKAELEAIKAQQIDGTQKVTLSGNLVSGGTGLTIIQRSGELAASTWEVVYTSQQSFEIVALEWSSNSHNKTYLYIEPRSSDGAYKGVGVIGIDGGLETARDIRPAFLKDIKSSLLSLENYSEQGQGCVIHLKKPLLCPNGGRIQVRNTDATTAFKVATQVVIREVVQ